MPQDIPVEASETLAFTPPSLEDHDPKPVFMLRAMTSRDKRFHARMIRENRLHLHRPADFRAAIEAGLKAMWDEASFDQHFPRIKAYWEQRDEFEQQLADEPDLVWTFDADEERKISDLIRHVEDNWPEIGRMYADNAEFGELMAPIIVAITVKNWTSFHTPRTLDRGYLTLECAEELMAQLEKLDAAAATELFVACTKRMTLEKDEEKNSASPSPSAMTPPPSNPMTTSVEADGTSPASASSTETPASESETSIGNSSGSTANAIEELPA